MRMHHLIQVCALGLALAGCNTTGSAVRQEDVDAWAGAPLSDLETHPIFLTMRLVRTKASDGTEIWNFVNGASVSACDGGGSVYSGFLSIASYSSFSACMSRVAACNNIFYVKGNRVQSYNPVGTGGARCYTDARAKPRFRGATNII